MAEPTKLNATGAGTTLSSEDLLSKKSILAQDEQAFLLDRDWVKVAFLADDDKIRTSTPVLERYRYWTTAQNKFVDTRLGGSIGINARPQFTPYSDIRVPGVLSNRVATTIGDTTGNQGLGRYYSEAIDDSSQTIYIGMGVPQFNSLTGFFRKAFDPNMTSMVRTGRGLSLAYNIGQVFGVMTMATAFPVLSAFMIGGRVLNYFFGTNSSRFYTLKPTPHLYWSAVNTLVNMIAINRGILPKMIADDITKQEIGKAMSVTQGLMKVLREQAPDIYTGGQNGERELADNGYDMYQIANRASMMHILREHKMFEAQNNTANDNSATKNEILPGILYYSYEGNRATLPPVQPRSFGKMIQETMEFGYYKTEADSSVKNEKGEDTGEKVINQSKVEENPKIDKDGKIKEPEGGYEKFKKILDSLYRDGARFATFKVEHTGAVSESFSNSAVESDLANKYNSTSSQAREARFSFADGNLGDGVVANTVETVLGAAKDLLAGGLNGLTMGIFDGLTGLMGSGFIDIPKHWQSSNVQLPRSNYRMRLISPYGNAISQMQNIYVPLAMILALALPRSTGNQSYGAPFLVEVFDRGRCQVRLGMIESLSITRGISNLAFNKLGKPLAIDVTFTVMDLSSIMHMPMSTGTLFQRNVTNPIASDMTMDEDNILMDYLAVLAGQDMYSQLYAWPKARLKAAKLARRFSVLTSPGYWASTVHDSTTSGLMQYLLPVGLLSNSHLPVPGAVIEAIVPGSGLATTGNNGLTN